MCADTNDTIKTIMGFLADFEKNIDTIFREACFFKWETMAMKGVKDFM